MYENITISIETQGSSFLCHARLKSDNCLTDGWAFNDDIAKAQQDAVAQAMQNQTLCNCGFTTEAKTVKTAEESEMPAEKPVSEVAETSEATETVEAAEVPEPVGVPAGWPFGNVDASCIPDDVKNIMPEQPKQPEPTESAPSAAPVSAESEAKPKKNPKKESVELTEEQVAARNVSSGGIIEKYGNMTLGEIFDEDKDAICFLASDLAEAPEDIQEAAAILVSLMGK